MLFRKKDPVVRRSARPYEGSFLQPLAVGLVSAVLVGLIVIMGFLDIRRNETNLVGFLEDQAKSTISVLERITEDNLKNIVAEQSQNQPKAKTASQQEENYFKKLVIETITDLGRDIDDKWRKKLINNEYLHKFAAENNLWYVAVLNREGNAIYESSPLKSYRIDEYDPEPSRRKITTLELLEEIRVKQKIGFMALGRTDGSGMVVINLDKDGMRYWSIKVAVERGLSKMGTGQGLVYIHIFNEHKKRLAGTGQAPDELDGSNVDYNAIIKGSLPLVSRKVDTADHKILDIAVPFMLDQKIEGLVRIGLERGSMDSILAENRHNIFIFMMLVVVIALLSMWLLFHDQNRHLAGIVDMERRLEKAERLSALGQLAAGVAHEIRNPLNAISMATQRLKRDFGPSDEARAQDFQNLSSVIRDEIRRLNGIIEEFLSFSKTRRLELSDFSVTEVLQKIIQLMQEEASARGIVLETRWKVAPAVIPMDINKLQQAFLNFVKNAMESITEAGKITITVEKESKKYLRVSITDTGCGMTEAEIERIFSPDYTTKEKGLGLGMPLAMEIIRGHGGDVRVTSQHGAGTTFDVILPIKRVTDKT